VLVKYFRNPILLKVVGTLVALSFLLAIVGYKNMVRFILPALIVFALFLLVRKYLINRRKKLTALEKDYLKRRFYED